MPKQKHAPKYRHYKPKNLGVVRIQGRDFYLGRYDSPESWEKYHRLIAEHIATNGNHPVQGQPSPKGLTVDSVLLRYWTYAESYYQRDGEATKELVCMRDALKPLRRLYGTAEAAEFGPLKLKVVRSHMIDEQDLCRNEINKRVGRIKRFFRWAVSEELVPPSIIHGLDSVKGLRRNKTRARETQKVKPVADQHVDAVLPFLPPQLRAMINIQRLTGMRPGEVVLMRECDIDRTTQHDIWVFFPHRHKKDWLDEPRAIAVGPQGQAILRPFLDRGPESYFFSPKEAYLWRLENRDVKSHGERKTKVYPSELRAREKAKLARRKISRSGKRNDHYTTESYWKSLQYGFKKAFEANVELVRWFPYQLRHSSATHLRKRFGVEASRVTLGHSRIDTTELYAERDLMLAIKIAREAG